MTTPPPPELVIYCNCMERVKHHMRIIEGALFGSAVAPDHPDRETLVIETVFLHFRKALEEIAFASLTANREKYAAARPSYPRDWSVAGIFKAIEKFNPHFYPLPLKEPTETAPGQKHFERMDDAYLTKADFELLYGVTSDIIHAPNPFSPPGPIPTHLTVQEWMTRIGRLLTWHLMQIPDLQGLWLIRVPSDGPCHAFLASSDGEFIVER